MDPRYILLASLNSPSNPFTMTHRSEGFCHTVKWCYRSLKNVLSCVLIIFSKCIQVLRMHFTIPYMKLRACILSLSLSALHLPCIIIFYFSCRAYMFIPHDRYFPLRTPCVSFTGLMFFQNFSCLAITVYSPT